MLVFAYDGSLNGDWVAHYAARFAANTRERRLRLVHVHDGSPPPHLPERIGRIAEECRLLGGWRYGQILAAGNPLYRAATGVTLVSVVFAQVANLVGRRYEERSGLDRGLLRKMRT